MFAAILTFALLFPSPVPVEYNLIDNFNCTYVTDGTKADVTLTWTLAFPAEQLAVFRGNQFKGWIGGNITSLTFSEPDLGAFQYTVAWVWKKAVYDYVTGILNLGRVTWDQPGSGAGSGFYLYILPSKTIPANPPAPVLDTKEINPADPYSVTEVPLKILLDNGSIQSNVTHYLAAATYLIEAGNSFNDENGDPMPTVSNLAPSDGALEFIYKDITWPNLPKLPLVPVQPIIEW